MKHEYTEIATLVELDEKGDLKAHLNKLTEEVGELAAVLNQLTGRKISTHDPALLDKMLVLEAADVIQCVFAILNKRGIPYAHVEIALGMANQNWKNKYNLHG